MRAGPRAPQQRKTTRHGTGSSVVVVPTDDAKHGTRRVRWLKLAAGEGLQRLGRRHSGHKVPRQVAQDSLYQDAGERSLFGVVRMDWHRSETCCNFS